MRIFYFYKRRIQHTPPLFPPPLGGTVKKIVTKTDMERILTDCILRQLRNMDAEALREVYNAVSRISEKGKKGKQRE